MFAMAAKTKKRVEEDKWDAGNVGGLIRDSSLLSHLPPQG